MPFRSHDAATDAIDRARNLLEGSRVKRGRKAHLPYPVRADMRRLSVVMAVAALDTYMHRLIVERAYTHLKLPGGLARLDLPFDQLLEWADESGVAARRRPHNSRPRVAVKRQLRDRLLRETFQRYEDVSKALGMAGLSKKWDEIGDEFDPPMVPKDLRTRLNQVVTRRNQIVHEGDYRRQERPRGAKQNGITYVQSKADIDFIAELIDAIHAVI